MNEPDEPEQSTPTSVNTTDGCCLVTLLGFIGTSFLLLTVFTATTLFAGLPIWGAIFLGMLTAAVIVAMCIGSKSDALDVVVRLVVVMLLLFILLPVFEKARQDKRKQHKVEHAPRVKD